jgi:uncharacterized protein (TIGR03083 family)
MSSQDALTALTEECRALSAVLHTLEPEDWRRPTNCPPWDLQELVVHTAASIATDGPLPNAAPEETRLGAADYYRRPERNTPAYRQRNVDQTQRLAAQVLASTSAVRWFDDVAQAAITELDADDLDRVVLIPRRGAMRLADWVVTRVISVAAHGLDVALTLGGRPAWTVPSALRVTRPVFVSLLGAEPPAALGWDDRAFLAVATGRRALTDEEREILGARQARLPVLS